MSSVPNILLVKLGDGTQIPVLGFGNGTAWYKPDRFSALNQDMLDMVKAAIAAGYRHFDTAEAYGTEAELGQAIKESGIPRQEFFVTTKIAQTFSEGSPGDAALGLENSLKRLQMDYVDLFLLHSPYCNKEMQYDEDNVAKQWKNIEPLQRSGKARSIGISNFRKTHVENLLKTAQIKPAVNQIMFHPYLQGAPEYAKWLQSRGIAVQGFMGLLPLTQLKGKHLDSTLEELARKYGVSPSTLLIRWELDQGIIVVNTTKKQERMREYFAALDLKLTEEDHDRITKVGQETHLRLPGGELYNGRDYSPY